MPSCEKTFGPGVKYEGPLWAGLDQSLAGFGLTLLDEDGGYVTYVFASDKSLPMVDRLLGIENWLTSRLGTFPTRVRNIAVESPVRASQAALISGQLFATVLRFTRTMMFHETSQYPLQVSPNSLKKYVTGKGTGVQKNQMLLATYKSFGVEFTDDNAADSYGLAQIASGFADTQYRRDVLESLKDPKFRGK